MTPEQLAVVGGLIFNAMVLAGTAYVVFGLGHSGWWFLLAVLCLVSVKTA